MKRRFFGFTLIWLASCSWNINGSLDKVKEKKVAVETGVVIPRSSYTGEKLLTGSIRNENINFKTNSAGQKLLEEKEEKKLEKIANLKSGLYFYWLDCHKLFKLPKSIRICERRGLMEAATSCDDSQYFKGMTPDEIFNKKKFDLLTDDEIKKAKQQCLDLLNKIK